MSKPVGPPQAAGRDAASGRARAATPRVGPRRRGQSHRRLGLRHHHRQDADGDPGRHSARGDRRGGVAAPDLSGRDRRQPPRPARGPEDDRQARAVSGGPGAATSDTAGRASDRALIRRTPTRRCSSSASPAGPDGRARRRRLALLLEPWAVQAALSRRRGGKRLYRRRRLRDRTLHPRCRHAALAARHRRMTDAAARSRDWIGYRRPPASSRFRKGQSGNPRGRPRGRRKAAALRGGARADGDDPRGRRRAAGHRRRGLPAARDQAGPRGRRRRRTGDNGRDRGRPCRPAGARAGTKCLSSAGSSSRPGSVTGALEPLRMGRKLDRYRETARMVLEPWIVEAALARLGSRR